MTPSNPFTITFGKEPSQLIARPLPLDEILSEFRAESPSIQAFILTGVRGSGKTVAMTQISEALGKESEWIVIDVNPEENITEQLVGKLASIPSLSTLFAKAEINLSLFGFGITLKNVPPIASIDAAAERILNLLKKTGKRLLITIDEVTNNKYVRVFAHSFQSYVRANDPVFLLMTGLYENISELQNEKSLTFLYRTPKITLRALNLNAIAEKYKSTFQLSKEEAMQMAGLTNGYPFAFQVLGFLRWNAKGASLEDLMPSYDQYLQEFVYEKIWAELSTRDRSIVRVIAHGITRNKDIREKLGMSSGLMSVYRKRLNDKGILDTSAYGEMRLILPRFDQFVCMIPAETE